MFGVRAGGWRGKWCWHPRRTQKAGVLPTSTRWYRRPLPSTPLSSAPTAATGACTPEQFSHWRQVAPTKPWPACLRHLMPTQSRYARWRSRRISKTPRSGSKGDQGSQKGAAAQGEGPGGGGGIAGAAKKVGGLQLGGRGRLTSAAQRRMAIELIVEANAAGARLVRVCCELGISLRILKPRSPGRGSATTTLTRNHCSAQPSIVRI